MLDQEQNAGTYRFLFNAAGLSIGIYIIQVIPGSLSDSYIK